MRNILIILLTIVTVFTGCGKLGAPKSETGGTDAEASKSQSIVTDSDLVSEEQDREGLSLDEIPVNRATVAKMLALTMLGVDEIDTLEVKISFTDVKETDWYFKYINAAVYLKYMLGGDGEFGPETPLSVYEAQLVLDRVNPGNKTKIKITEETGKLPISHALWSQLYIKAITELAQADQDKTPEAKFGLSRKELIVLATPGNTGTLPSWSMVTDKGAYFFKGLNMDAYIDKKISVYIKQNETAFIEQVIDDEPVLENAYIKAGQKGAITVFAGGAERTYRTDKEQEILSEIADVKISGKTAEIIDFRTSRKTGEIKRVSDKYIELADGRLDMGEIAVYGLDGGSLAYKSVSWLIVGTDTSVFYLKDGIVCAAVIKETPKPDKMRVLIGSSDYRMTVHTSVALTATSDYTVVTKNGEKNYKKGETLTFNKDSNSDLFSSERIYIKPDNGLVELLSVKRGGASPKYRGTIELSKEGEAFIIVNELDFEEYLYSVVAGQMPETLGTVAAMAQAVVSRSSAYNQFYMSRFANYGANVDDSVRSQLYNAAPETETAINAVEGTKGEVLSYAGEIIKPTFFLASAGYTANRGETWQKAGGTKFPSDTPGYLKAAKQYKSGDYGDLRLEENAARFFKSQDVDGYERGVSWFRWSFRMDKATIEASINANIKERANSYPSQVLTLSDGVYSQKPVEGIGELIDMVVTGRGEGGNVMEIRLVGTNGEYLIKTENNIRMLIRPYQYAKDKPPVILTRSDGTKIENYQTLPSAFFTFDIERGENGKIISVSLYGGGNGHGVGMSQCGAKALADAGTSYGDILKHYYGGSEIEKIK